MNKKTNHYLIILLLSSFIVKILFAILPGFIIDTSAWYAWSLRMINPGITGFYSPNVWTNYTPGFLYLLAPLGFIKTILPLDDSSFYFLLKLPSIIADLICGYLIYHILKTKISTKFALVAVTLYLFNPAVIFNSSIWGQIDGLLSLFILTTIYFLDQKKTIPSSIFWGLSILIKPQSLALLPVFIFYTLKDFSIKKIFQITLPALFIILILSSPFFPYDPFLGIFKLVLQMSKDYPGTSMFAYNFWGIFGFWQDDQFVFSFLTYQQWGIIFYILFWIATFFLSGKKANIFALTTLALLTFYFLPTRVHERYLLPAFPFLVVTAFIYKSQLLSLFTFLLSLTHLINLYYVYVYYNELYQKLPKVLYQMEFYTFIEKNSQLFSILQTLFFISISVIILHHTIKTNEKPTSSA